jgi:hypothetical protein
MAPMHEASYVICVTRGGYFDIFSGCLQCIVFNFSATQLNFIPYCERYVLIEAGRDGCPQPSEMLT